MAFGAILIGQSGPILLAAFDIVRESSRHSSKRLVSPWQPQNHSVRIINGEGCHVSIIYVASLNLTGRWGLEKYVRGSPKLISRAHGAAGAIAALSSGDNLQITALNLPFACRGICSTCSKTTLTLPILAVICRIRESAASRSKSLPGM